MVLYQEMISVEIYVYVNLPLPILSSFRPLTDCVIKIRFNPLCTSMASLYMC